MTSSFVLALGRRQRSRKAGLSEELAKDPADSKEAGREPHHFGDQEQRPCHRLGGSSWRHLVYELEGARTEETWTWYLDLEVSSFHDNKYEFKRLREKEGCCIGSTNPKETSSFYM